MIFSSELFSSHAGEAEKILGAHGFVMMHDSQAKNSALHVAQYLRGEEKIILECNEQEKWLRLVNKGENQIEELLFRPLRDASPAECERAMRDAMNMLTHFFTAHMHDDDDENICGCAHHHA